MIYRCSQRIRTKLPLHPVHSQLTHLQQPMVAYGEIYVRIFFKFHIIEFAIFERVYN